MDSRYSIDALPVYKIKRFMEKNMVLLLIYLNLESIEREGISEPLYLKVKTGKYIQDITEGTFQWMG